MDPAIASRKKELFRPSQAIRHDNQEGLQTALEDFYNELGSIDFDSQFDSKQKESKIGRGLRSWVRKRFGVPISQTLAAEIDNMQTEMKGLHLDAKKQVVNTDDHRGTQNGPNLLAGSSHSRVIAPLNPSPTPPRQR